MARSKASWLAGRNAALLNDPRNSARVLLRMVSVVPGPEPRPNPPRASGLAVDGAHAAGAAVLHLKGAALAGRIVAGDRFLASGVELVAAADVPCADDDTAAVPLAVPVPVAGLAAGAPVAAKWSREKWVGAKVEPFAVVLVDGTLIKRTDLNVVVAAAGLPSKPDPQWRVVLPDGSERTVVQALPESVDGVPVRWSLQVR